MKLINKVKLINLKTNDCEIYLYDYLNENRNIRIQIKEKLDSGNYKLLCGCNDHELGIKVNYIIYVVKQNTKHLHHPHCPKSEQYESWNKKYNTGVKEEEGSDKVEVNLNFSLKQTTGRIVTIDHNPIRTKEISNSDEIDGKISLLSLATHLNLIAWKRVLKRDNELISNKNDYLGYVYGTARNFKIAGKDLYLQDIMFDYNKDKDLPSKEIRFIYGYIVDYKINPKKENEYILYIQYKKNANPFKFVVDKKDFLLLWNNLKYKQFEYVAIAGLVTKNYGSYKLIDLALFNINNNGLYSESSYEIRYYNLLCENNIHFYKPYKRLLEYDGYIPDGIIEVENKTIFIEVFGMTTPDYLVKREAKINIINELSETHSLLKWDAFLDKNLPNINEIYEIINKI